MIRYFYIYSSDCGVVDTQKDFMFRVNDSTKMGMYRESSVKFWSSCESPEKYKRAYEWFIRTDTKSKEISQEEANRICKAWWNNDQY